MTDDITFDSNYDMAPPEIETIVNAAGLLQLIPIYGRSMSGKVSYFISIHISNAADILVRA